MKRIAVILFAGFSVFLSGCMYPQGELAKNTVPNETQLQMIQTAVEKFKENNQGIVPIRTKPNDTPVYQKYLIDFTRLKQEGLISDIPGTAFENGGTYQYVLINPEENPQVKLIDLRISQKIGEVSRLIDAYRDEHLYPPFGEKVDQGVYAIDYKKIGLDHAPYVKSPYSQKNLPLVLDGNGTLHVDYRADLYEALRAYEGEYKAGNDIRSLLTEQSPFVPAYSLPYKEVNGEPKFAAY